MKLKYRFFLVGRLANNDKWEQLGEIEADARGGFITAFYESLSRAYDSLKKDHGDSGSLRG